jgi:hypothetical protein
MKKPPDSRKHEGSIRAIIGANENGGGAMKTRRSLNHREFSVATAGWFTVLRPDPFRLGSFAGRSKQAPRHNGGKDPIVAPSMMQLFTEDLSPKRTVLIASIAITMTSVLLWCIMHP